MGEEQSTGLVPLVHKVEQTGVHGVAHELHLVPVNLQLHVHQVCGQL